MPAEELRHTPQSGDPRPTRPGTPLTPAGLSADGEQLNFVDELGSEYTVSIDPQLRALLRDDSDDQRSDRTAAAPLTKVEKKMESTLRPRDIQHRIRAGETVEAVAEAAGTSVERIMAFAAPVLAEREHVTQFAQRSSVRRHGEGGERTLGPAVEAWLRERNVKPETVEWDAWRREDGRWHLTATYVCAERQGTAEFTYDQRGSFVTLDNDDARWLVGDLPPEPAARNDLADARARRRSQVDVDQLTFDDAGYSLGDDAIGLVRADAEDGTVDDAGTADAADADAPTADLSEAAATVRELPTDPPARPERDEPAARTEPPEPTETKAPEKAPTANEKPAEDAPEPPKRRPAKKKNRGRASVPSWDEIMFGGKPE